MMYGDPEDSSKKMASQTEGAERLKKLSVEKYLHVSDGS